MNEEAPPWLGKLSDLRRVIQRQEQSQQQKKIKPPRTPYHERNEKVVNGTIKWKPVDKTAALVVAPAHWPYKLDDVIQQPATEKPKKRRRKKRKMSKEIEVIPASQAGKIEGNYTSQSGIRISHTPNGEALFNLDDVHQFIAAEIAKLPRETRPNVQAAQDARRIISELVDGLGGDMEQFRQNTKRYLEDIRQTRFAVVAEIAQMTNSLKEIRQFFLGGDYKDEITRLREFVELCERLESLKTRGTLDAIADTMIKLAV